MKRALRLSLLLLSPLLSASVYGQITKVSTAPFTGGVLTDALRVPAGTSGAPGLAVGAANVGIWSPYAEALATTHTMHVGGYASTLVSRIGLGAVRLGSAVTISWTSGNETGTIDTQLSRDAAGTIAQKLGNADTVWRHYGANGGYWERASASELVTLSTSGTTTDTSANLLPANGIIEAVTARVTTAITTATDWKLGDATTAGRFSAANSTLAVGTTQVGLVHADQTGAAGPVQTAAAKLRITTTGTPGAGAIRVTVYYRRFVPPAS